MEANEQTPVSGVVAAASAAPRSRWRRPLLIAGPLLAISAVALLYSTSGRYESTDNASLQAAQVAIAANVSGKVIAIDVRENENVRRGQVLFRINPEPFQAAVDEAEAQLAAARTDIDSLRASFAQTQADIDAASARLAHAEAEAQRQRSLLAIGVSTRSRYEEALLTLRTAEETLKSARARSASVRASLAGVVDAPIDNHPAVRRAQAALERARIALNDTTVPAPQDGIVTRVNQLQVGTYVSASRPLFVLIGTRVWVEANFKENQLRHMRQGQPATVAIDAYPDHELKARVASFSPGTGHSFSLLAPDRHGPAMAIYGLATMLGPVVGPLLGGWLTDTWSWRWAFLINVPCGIVAFVGMSRVMSETRLEQPSRFDIMGFATLAVFLASLQLVLDRGPQLDWFDSWEVRIEAVIIVLFGYLTIVHTFTAREPFIRPTLFRDRNFLFGSLMSAQLGILVFAVIPLITTMLQQLMRYPVMLTGMVTAPRGVGTMLSMIVVAKLITRVDKRLLIFLGLVLSATGMYQMSHMSLYMDERVIVVSGLLQGLASGFIFVPLSILVFSTLDPRHRNAGSALFALTRNVGASVGVSVLQVMTIHNSVTVQSRLAEAIRPDNPALALRAPELDFDAPATIAGMEREIERQAAMVGYVDSYWFLFVLTLVMIPIALLMKSSRKQSRA